MYLFIVDNIVAKLVRCLHETPHLVPLTEKASTDDVSYF